MEMRILNKRKFANAHAKRWIRYLVPFAVIVSFMVFSFAVSSEGTVFGPKTYTRTSGPFNVFQESFSIADINSSFTVIVQNGDPAGGRLSSAKIVLNGAEIVKPSDFNQQVQEIRRTVVLRENNTLTVELQSKPGSFITISIIRDPIPVLSITSPLPGTVFRSQPITVEGTIDIASAQVTVNGVPAVVNGGRFIAQNVPLIRDGMNTITAIGTAPGGNTGQASVMVILDTMAPTIVIDSPSNGFVTPDNTISVSGMVSDVITPNPMVLVNDVPATVSNGTFLAMGVPLNMGDNQITATARDGVGNQSTTSITVRRADLPGLRLQIISGQAQTALIKSSLPEPLRVKLIDAADNAVSNREVVFQVSRGDGTVRNAPPLPGQTGQRTLILNTDENGEAAVRFELGSRTGPGNNRVQASVVGALSPVEFSATATSGAPDRIAIVPMSNQQTGVVNQPLGMPFGCVVLDASGNPVAGVPVTFQVTEGGGNFGGNPSFVEATGADGVAHAVLTLGPEPGTQNNAVGAAFQGQTDPPITFVASGRVPGLLGNTTFSGLVLDNGDLPLRNARAVIFGTDRSAVTDATGRFLITNVPPGAQRLLIDGSGIVDSQGRIFPGLEFDLNVIGGVENSLPMPIYLPPLSTDPQSVARITDPVASPITLQIPGIPQATLTLLAGTVVSNHNGPASAGNPITVRLSRVNNDRVPMPPPNGSVFTLAGTVQPAGTHFSIPARVCSPNTGMLPGAQVDIFSFDHDVGQFLSIGFATVSEDGSVVCSNPGFGINKAGWFGATPPPPPTTETKNCRVVSVTANPNPVSIPQVVGPPISGEVVITATTDPSSKTVTWSGDLGDTPNISGNTLRTRYGTPGEKMVTATCEQSSKAVTVKVVQADLDIQGLSEADEDSVGGLVVRNFDTNSAPRKRIIIQKIAPSSFTGNVILTSGSTKIKAFTAATGGTEITFNGTDNKFANSGLPKDLFVEGTGFSDTMRDVQLRTEIENVANSNDTVSFTVLWVDQPVVLTAGTISADNDKKNGYQGWTVANTLSLGVQFYNANFGARMGWGTEAGALVHPSNFNYPGNDLKLEREVEFHDWIGNGTSSIDQRSFSASIPPANDTGPPAARDDNPPPNGIIYDWDAPGLAIPSAPQNQIRRTRNNFKAFASITIDGTAVRSSPIRNYFVRFSMKQTAPGNGSTWVILNPVDVVGDNQAGNGTTTLTWNLVP